MAVATIYLVVGNEPSVKTVWIPACAGMTVMKNNRHDVPIRAFITERSRGTPWRAKREGALFALREKR